MQGIGVFSDQRKPAHILIKAIVVRVVINGADLSHKYLSFSWFAVKFMINTLFEAYAFTRS
jgi:hypothetical protein